jgi:hypothetical protein
LSRTSVTASRVCRRGKTGLVLLELAIKLLNVAKKIIKCCTWICFDSSAKIVVVLAEAMKDIVYKFIDIHRLADTSELRSDALHLGEVLVSRKIVLACVLEGGSELLDPRLGLRRDMAIECFPHRGGGVEVENMSKHIWRHGVEEPSHHMLISRDPCLI